MYTEEFARNYTELSAKIAELEQLKTEFEQFKVSLQTRIRRNEINSKEIVDEYLRGGKGRDSQRTYSTRNGEVRLKRR